MKTESQTFMDYVKTIWHLLGLIFKRYILRKYKGR
jgi:hypothetical protein